MSLRKSGLVICEWSTASQLSWSVAISSLSRPLVSSDNFASHASLSNLIGVLTVRGDESCDWDDTVGLLALVVALGVVGLDLGAEKKDVMDALALGFLTESVTASTALRLRDMLLDVCCGNVRLMNATNTLRAESLRDAFGR